MALPRIHTPRGPTMIAPGWFSILLTTMLAWAPPGDAAAGKPVSFNLQDFRGGWHRLDDAGKDKAVVIAFLGTDCPLASLYAPKLAELARAYEKKGVAFFSVNSNQQDAPSDLSRFAREHDLPFPLLKDVGNELADRLGVERHARGLRAGREPGRPVPRAGGRPVRLRRPSPGPDAPRARRGARGPARRPAGRHAADRPRRLPCRPDREGQGRRDRHLLEAGGAHPPRPLRRLPPRG